MRYSEYSKKGNGGSEFTEDDSAGNCGLEEYLYLIRQELGEDSAFTAFKRWMIWQNESGLTEILMPERDH